MTQHYDRAVSQFERALAEAIKNEVEFPLGTLVTLVHAEITGDLRYAKGTLSVLPASREQDVLDALKMQSRYIKESLNKELRLRRIPSLHWDFDNTEEEAAKIEADLFTLKKKGEL